MKLSEAIREGSKIYPKAVGVYVERNDSGVVGHCALGAAFYAIKGYSAYDNYDYSDNSEVLSAISEHVGYSLEERLVGHVPGGFAEEDDEFTVKDAVVSLNDETDWTREQIADWLEAKGL